MDIKEVVDLLNVAQEEIQHSLNPHKDKQTKEVYLYNAIRFIEMAKEKMGM